MLVVSSREFRDNQRKYFDLVDKNEHVIVKRSKNRAYKLTPVSENDLLFEIPEKYRVNPYDISPTGDPFWADKRNVDFVLNRIKELEEGKAGPMTRIRDPKNIWQDIL